MLLTVIIMIVLLLIGYCWGKRVGRQEGYQEGLVHLPLALREQSLEQGYCALCKEELENKPLPHN